jgi:glycosyltransferase involved in cell wall biosynthesis
VEDSEEEIMKIVIDAREFSTSSGRYVERLIHYLQLVDNVNCYDILLKTKDFDAWQPSNPRFNKIRCDVKEFTFAEQLKLRRIINSLKPDLVHFAFAHQPILYKGKTITTVHDLTTLRFYNPSKNPVVFKLKQQVYGWVVKKSVKKSSNVITPSQYVKDDLVKYSKIDANKVTVTYESADPINQPAEAYADLVGKQFIMYVGRPTPHKNLPRLIEAFTALKKTHPELKLVLAGKKDINYKHIEEQVNQFKVSDVIFTDFISEGQLKWLYQNCTAYVFPSLSEGFGLPGLEAMICNAPVVSSNATCLPEVYGDAAIYFDPLDVNDITKVIEKVLSSPDIQNELKTNAQAVLKKYSWQKMAKQTLNLYNS